MSLARAFLRAFFVFAALAVFVVFFIQPTASLPPEFSILAVLVIELLAWILARLAAPTGFLRTLIRVFLLSLFTAAFVVYVLHPATQFSLDFSFLVVFMIETVGFLVAGVLTINRKHVGVMRRH